MLEDRNDDAEAQLRKVLAWEAPEHPGSSRSVSGALQVRIFRRDSFTCRYCGRQTIFLPVLRLLAMSFGHIFPYHPSWKMISCHMGFWRDSASCDHKVPIARLGSSEEENLVTPATCATPSNRTGLLRSLDGNSYPQQLLRGTDCPPVIPGFSASCSRDSQRHAHDMFGTGFGWWKERCRHNDRFLRSFAERFVLSVLAETTTHQTFTDDFGTECVLFDAFSIENSPEAWSC